MQAEQKITSTDDRAAITRTIETYVNGGRSGKGDDMKPVFHSLATIAGYVGDDLLAGPIQFLFDWYDRNGPATELRHRITDIDIMNTIATVRLELDNWTGHRFTDMFTLLKTDGEESHEQGLPSSPLRVCRGNTFSRFLCSTSVCSVSLWCEYFANQQ